MSRRLAILFVGCVLFVSGNIYAQFGYTDEHEDGVLTEWSQIGARAWNEADSFAQPAHNTGGQGFLVNNYDCADNGTYEVTYESTAGHSLHMGGIVFRFTDASNFYFVGVEIGWDGGASPNNQIRLYKNSLWVDNEGVLVVNNLNFSGVDRFTLKVELNGSDFTFWFNDVLVGVVTDTDHPSGKVGYAYSDTWSNYILFDRSSWQDAPPTFLEGYLTFDTSASVGIQVGSATWGADDYWTTDGTTLVPWPAEGNSAYFGGDDGTYEITVDGLQVVDTIQIGASGYSIVGDTLQIGGNVIVHPEKTVSIGSVLSGSAGLLYSGGTAVLSGANTYSGATEISTGSLKITDAAALGDDLFATTVSDGASLEIEGGLSITEPLVLNGSGSGNGALVSSSGNNILSGTVTLNSASTISAASPLIISGTIDGAGDLTKTGTSLLALGGANTYTGATTVSQGGVLLTSTAALGDPAGETEVSPGAAIVIAGDVADGSVFAEPITLRGSGISSDGALSFRTGAASSAVWSGNVSLAAASSIGVADAGDTLSITGAVGGARLTKVGSGLLVLAEDNTYSSTVVSAGKLQIGEGGAAGSVDGNISTSAETEVIVDRSGTFTFSDSIKGAGALVKKGAGTLVLAETNTYSGGTTVEEGTLQVGNGTSGMIAGDIANDGSLVFSRSDNASYGGVISGTGNLTKEGTGILTLTGNNSYSGATTVSAGTLRVNGTHSGSGVVNVENSAALGGNGSISGNVSIADGGILSPGGAAEGTMAIGSLTLSGTSELKFDIGTSSDSIAVNGDLILDGVINITDGAGFGPGIFNIISFTGDVTDNDLVVGTKPVNTLHYRVQVYGNNVRLIVSDDLPISNSVTVRGRRLTDTSVELTIGGYSSIPYEESVITSYADTVGIWHRYGSFFDSPDVSVSSDNLLKISLSDMNAVGNTFKDTIAVPELTDDQFYFVCGTPFWYDIENRKDSIPDFIFEQGDSVFMVNPDSLMNNPLSVKAEKVSDSEISLTIEGYDAIPHQTDPHKPYADSIGVWYRFQSFCDSPEAQGTVIKYSVADLKGHSPDFTDVINVLTSVEPQDSFYFFNATVLWRIPPDDGTVVPYPEMSPGDSVYMKDPGAEVQENKLRVQGKKIKPDTVELSIQGFSDLPDREVAYKPYVDSIGVWYKYGGWPQDPSWNMVDMVKMSLSEMKSGGAETYRKKVYVKPFELGSADSSCYFLASARWRNLDSIPPFDTQRGDSVFMAEVALPENTCTISAEQPDVLEDLVVATVSGVDNLDELADSVYVYFSFTSLFIGDHFLFHKKAVADVEGGSYTIELNRPEFIGKTETVYTRIVIRGIHKKNSNPADSFFTVGRPLPENTISGLSAEAMGPSVVRLSWDSVTDADSIFLLYRTIPVTPGRYTSQEFILRLSASRTDYEIDNLEAEQLYHFGLALVDAQNDSVLISDITENAITYVQTTGLDPIDYLKNLIVIDESSYIDSTLNFRVEFHLSDTIYEELDYGYVVSLNPNDPAQPQEAYPIRSLVDSFHTVSLGTSALFDTTYYIIMYMGKDGFWTEQTPGAKDTVAVGSFQKQPVSYFASESQPVYANNRKIVLRAESGWLGTIEDTVVLFSGGSSDGFISVGDGFRFKAGKDSPEFRVGLVAESVPDGYSLEDIRMYRWVEDKGWMVAESKIDALDNTVSAKVRLTEAPFYNAPFRLLIDTARVDLEVLTRTDVPVEAEKVIRDTFLIKDNIANVTATLVYGKADENFRTPVVEVLESVESTLPVAIPASAAAEHLGVRAFLIVSDGRHTDTLNISRQVRSGKYVMPTVSRKWVPFHAKVTLDAVSAQRALSLMLGDDKEFKYDNTRFRLFRWFQTPSNRSRDNRWVEFNETEKDSFDLVPGRLMWLKVDKTEALDLGASVSISLTDTFSMVLAPEEWTDFVLPYGFPIRIADILEATGAGSDQLQFYSWVEDGSGQYRTELLYTPGTGDPQLSDSTKELKGGLGDAYTVRSYSQKPVVLRIPPTLSSMSKFSRSLSKQNSEVKDIWYVKVKCRTGRNADLNPVMAGFSTQKRAFAVPPSFGSQKVTVFDEQTGRACGHLFSPEFHEGGRTFVLRFSNSGKEKTTFTYTAERSRWIPDSMQVKYVSASTGEFIEGGTERKITVDAQSHEDVLMVVGSEDYIRKNGVSPESMKFRFGGIRVNHSARTARVSYYMPLAGVDRIEISVLDMKGRAIWRQVEKGRTSVWNTVQWNGKTLQGGSVSAGSYIMRIRALNGKGATAATVDRRFMIVP